MRGNVSKVVVPGAVFGRLTVIEKLPKNEKGRYKTRCVCNCGKEVLVETTNLGTGNSKSCGCWNNEVRAARIKEVKRLASCHTKIQIGSRFGKLKVVGFDDLTGKKRVVVCVCDCETTIETTVESLLYNGRESCGCINRELTTQRNKSTARFDGFSASEVTAPVFKVWQSMMLRCYNEQQKAYKEYGAKGVKVCRYLQTAPQNLAAILGLKPYPKASLDRYPIHNGNYTCGQCEECKQNGWQLNIRWASRKEQSLNRGDFNVYITAFGKTLTKSQWMELSGLGWKCLTGRLRRGWDVERALTTSDSFGNKLDVLRLVNV